MNQNESERLTRLETQVENLNLLMGSVGTDIKEIMRNHLPHLTLIINERTAKLKEGFDKRMDKQDKKINILMIKVGTIITAGVALINYLARRFLP